MEPSVKHKEAFEAQERHGAFYTGGQIQWTKDGKHLLCQCGETVQVLDVEAGRITEILGKNVDEDGAEEHISTFTLSLDDELVVTSHKNNLFRLWKWKDELVLKLWKSVHKGPVARLAFAPENSTLASGGTDGSVRIWNLDHQSCTHNLKGLTGVVSVLKFHPSHKEKIVFAAADNTVIIGWSLNSGQPVLSLKGHFSTVTSLVFVADGDYLISSGRDKVLIFWDLKNEGSIVRTIPTFESIEAMVMLPFGSKLPGIEIEKFAEPSNIHVATAGENGIIRIWQVAKGREVYSQDNSVVNKAAEEGGLAITHLLFNSVGSSLAVVSADHNIIIHELHSFKCVKQFVGFTDEVLDVVFMGKLESHIVVATNSCDIKVYNASNFNCQLVKGHTDIVLSLCVAKTNPFLLASSGKDNTVRLWRMNAEDGVVTAISVGSLHSASVGSVAFSSTTASFLVSVSQDTCLKMWKVPLQCTGSEEVHGSLVVSHTVVAHQKDINGVCVAPNDKLIATASQDKTVKLWSSDSLELLGVLRGHRRGVWSVCFSPVDQVLASASADATIKLWLLEDLSCWKTLEGHDASVLHLEFISRGMQIITSGGDGLMKLWTVKSGECAVSWDAHDGRVWAMAVSKNEKLVVSGGSDSTLVIWKDVTSEKKNEAAKERDLLTEKEQTLANLLQSEKLLSALSLALSLDRPYQVLNIVREIMKKGKGGLEKTVKQLSKTDKEALLKFATTWNCNSKSCYPAQLVISILLDELITIKDDDIAPIVSPSVVEGIIPYTERHFHRLSQLLLDLHLLKLTATQMKITK
ncbi:hypothetical protein J437_LFUL009607 [Ladona fulva]|uniref:U3 small nucleolar RNA-associated protein 13 C-terminal domain-containing protein n=1 Tax=Ladona fulva TaxID=123851 RepID=A0A8K0JUE0_LADFU|nr:hypothetical protein J437_LFUL009607 [Ladona fulva]